MNSVNAAADNANPGGTGMPAREQLAEAGALAAEVVGVGRPQVRQAR